MFTFFRCCSVAARSQQLSSRAQKACSLHQDATKGTGKKSMQRASLSPKTRDDASLRQPTFQNAKLLFGSRTAEWRRKSLSVNPRLIITCILDVCFVLFRQLISFRPESLIFTSVQKSWMKNAQGSLAPNLSSFTLFNLKHAHHNRSLFGSLGI